MARSGPVPILGTAALDSRAADAKNPKQDRPKLEVTMDDLLNVLNKPGDGSYNRVRNLEQQVVACVMTRMNANAATSGKRSRAFAAQDRLQQGFWLDETVARELDNFFDMLLERNGPGMDDCALWHLMHYTIEEIETKQTNETSKHPAVLTTNGEIGLLSPSATDITESDACRELSRALVRMIPKHVFAKLCPVHSTKCHHKRFLHSAFDAAIQNGLSQLVKYTIDQFLNSPGRGHTLEQEEITPTLKNDPIHELNKNLISSYSVRKAIESYRDLYTKDLDILEEFLKLDEGNQQDMDDNKPQRLISESTLTWVIENLGGDDNWENCPLLHVVKAVLKYRQDLKTTVVINKALFRTNPLLVELFVKDIKIEKSVAETMINFRLDKIWALPSVHDAVNILFEDESIARELFRLALEKEGSSGPMSFLPACSVSSKGQPAASSSEKNPVVDSVNGDDHHIHVSFGEDILRRIGSFDSDIREDIVKSGRLWFWKLPYVQGLWQEEIAKDENLCMLHVAVQYQKVEMVKYFLRDEPKSLFQPVKVPTLGKDVFALWHNNFFVPEGSSTSISRQPTLSPASSETDTKNLNADNLSPPEEIRKLLVPSAIERASSMGSLVKMFRESGERPGLTCFDLSNFAFRPNSVDEFMRSLCGVLNADRDRHLKFEEVLRYAAFPSFDRSQWDMSMEKPQDEVFHVLLWLRKEKHVKKIMSLNVLDRMYCPHDERDIAFMARSFRVEKLDWRFLDMAISYLTDENLTPSNSKLTARKAPPERLTELRLYSSGKRAAVDHWLGQNGVNTLPNLEKLYIYLVLDIISPPLLTSLEKIIAKGIENINKSRVEAKKPEIKYEPIPYSWNSTPRNSTENLQEIAERAFPDIYKDIVKYSNRFLQVHGPKTKVRRTRVAILDSGILTIPMLQAEKEENNGMWPRIAEGESFFNDTDRLPPWQFASDPHGTQIANVISAIDPHCEIYIAKVTEGRHGIKPDNVADAILWAEEKKVDIISMSLAIPEYNYNKDTDYAKDLKDAITVAGKSDIIQLCSNHDEGWNVRRCWPAAASEWVKVVVACDEYGAMDREPGKHHYQIPGINIFTGAVPYLESKDTMSGSSVSTAIAAGLASLVLSCYRLQHGPEAKIPAGRRVFVHEAFINMSIQGKDDDKDSPKYLRLENFKEFAKAKENGKPKYPWFV